MDPKSGDIGATNPSVGLERSDPGRAGTGIVATMPVSNATDDSSGPLRPTLDLR